MYTFHHGRFTLPNHGGPLIIPALYVTAIGLHGDDSQVFSLEPTFQCLPLCVIQGSCTYMVLWFDRPITEPCTVESRGHGLVLLIIEVSLSKIVPAARNFIAAQTMNISRLIILGQWDDGDWGAEPQSSHLWRLFLSKVNARSFLKVSSSGRWRIEQAKSDENGSTESYGGASFLGYLLIITSRFLRSGSDPLVPDSSYTYG